MGDNMEKEKIDQNRIMEVIDENGTSKNMYILFTTTLEDDNNNYVFYYDKENDSDEVNVSIYTDDGQLIPVEDDETYAKLEEVFNQFIEDSKKVNNNEK